MRWRWRKSVANGLLHLARWLNPTWEQDWFQISMPIQLMANEQVIRLRAIPGVSNEYRRNEGYAYVSKRFPYTQKRIVAMAVELAVWRC